MSLALLPWPGLTLSPPIASRSSSASTALYGFDEYGTPSNPPKKYLVETQSGAFTFNFGTTEEPANFENVYSGAASYAAPGGVLTDATQLSVSGPDGSTDTFGWSATSSGVFKWVRELSPPYGTSNVGGVSRAFTVDSTTSKHVDSSAFGNPDYDSGLLTVSLSSEYTAVLQVADIDAAIATFAGEFREEANPSAIYHIADSGVITRRRFEYKIALNVISWGTVLDWAERFTPADVNAEVVDTLRSYSWTSGETETPVYTVEPPAEPGTVTIVFNP